MFQIKQFCFLKPYCLDLYQYFHFYLYINTPYILIPSNTLKSLTGYIMAKLKLIAERCLTYVFNPLTYVLVFVAKIQDASFPPTHSYPGTYNHKQHVHYCVKH